MQAGQLTIATPNVARLDSTSVTGKISEWVARVFGCWHMEMSRPFSHQGQAYRVCLDCGAHRQFNLNNWKMQGDYYFQRATSGRFESLAAVRKAA